MPGRLVEADTGDSAHFPHQLSHVDALGAGVRGADSEARVVRDHLGQDVEDGLRKVVSLDHARWSGIGRGEHTLDTVLS